MTTNFPPYRWNHIKQVYRQWWSQTLDRPVINAVLYRLLYRPEPGVEKQEDEMHGSLWQYPLNVPAETIVLH